VKLKHWKKKNSSDNLKEILKLERSNKMNKERKIIRIIIKVLIIILVGAALVALSIYFELWSKGFLR